MDCIYIACFYTLAAPKALYNFASHSLIHTHTHTSRRRRAAMQGVALPIGSNLGFRVLSRILQHMAWEESGIEPPTLRLTDDPLYPLSHSRSNNVNTITCTFTGFTEFTELVLAADQHVFNIFPSLARIPLGLLQP